jgi:hypothetical protein
VTYTRSFVEKHFETLRLQQGVIKKLVLSIFFCQRRTPFLRESFLVIFLQAIAVPGIEVNFGTNFRSVMNNIPDQEPPPGHKYLTEYPYDGSYLKQKTPPT